MLSNVGEFPESIDDTVTRNVDELVIEDITAISIDNFVVTPFALVAPTIVTDTVTQDSDTMDYLDDLEDGVVITEIQVPEDAKRLITKTTESTANDIDLFLLYDVNDDGFLSSTEEIARSISFNEIEEIEVNFPEPGRYFIVVQNFTASSASTDSFTLEYAVVTNQIDTNLTTDAPTSVADGEEFDISVIHDFEAVDEGTVLYGALGLSNRVTDRDRLGIIRINLEQDTFDTQITGESARLENGQQASLTVRVNPNVTDRERAYRVSVPAPEGTAFTQWTTANDGTLDEGELTWLVTKPVGDSSVTELEFEVQVLTDLPPGPIEVNVTSELLNRDFSSVLSLPAFSGLQVEGPPTLTFNNGNTGQFEVVETRIIEIPLTTSDPNDDDVTVVWNQTSGTPIASIVQTQNSTRITAPSVSQDETLTFEVVASDDFDNSTSENVSILVTNNEAPTIDSVSAPTTANQGQSVTISFTASDPENDDLTFSIAGVEGSSRTVTLPRTGTVANFTLSVTDGVNTTTQTVTINLNPVSQGDSGGGGSTQWLFIAFCVVSLLIRRGFRD